jgi:ABC-type transporter Mla subunit MlaD
MDYEQHERQLMRKTKAKVLALLLSAAALAFVFAYWMGAFNFEFSKEIHLRYRFAGGIDRGSPVRLGGIRVGRVTRVEFVESPEANIELSISVTGAAFKQITKDSQFYINLAGLIGERYIEVVPGNGASVAKGDILRGIDPPRIDQLISQGYGVFEDVRNFFNANKEDFKEMLQMMNSLASNLNMLMGGQKGKQTLPATAQEFRQLTNELLMFVSRANRGLAYIESNGGARTWANFNDLLNKGNQIHINDLRRLMMEDGVKVNFSAKKVEVAQ